LELEHHKRRILVVDDDEAVRAALVKALQDAGCEVLQAADGEEALALIAKEKVDLVVSDLEMPRCDGLELLRKAGQTLPILLMSGARTSALATLAVSQGALDFLAKPVRAEQVLAHLPDAT